MSKTFPVTEVFGSTIQGEGPDAGLPVKFVRFGGCDYQCSWCDSLHAVLPEHVRQAPRLTAEEVVDALNALDGGATTVVLSGGNPVLHDLGELVSLLFDAGYRTTVETQGSKWKPWLIDVDLVVVSPKPPSSGMTTDWDALHHLMQRMRLDAPGSDVALKVVVGDQADYEFATEVHQLYPRVPFYLSVLNPAGSDGPSFDLAAILSGYQALCELVAADPAMSNARVMPQLHTLAWGSEQGR